MEAMISGMLFSEVRIIKNSGIRKMMHRMVSNMMTKTFFSFLLDLMFISSFSQYPYQCLDCRI